MLVFPLFVGEEVLSQVKKFKTHGVLFTSEACPPDTYQGSCCRHVLLGGGIEEDPAQRLCVIAGLEILVKPPGRDELEGSLGISASTFGTQLQINRRQDKMNPFILQINKTRY